MKLGVEHNAIKVIGDERSYCLQAWFGSFWGGREKGEKVR
jgi:hypothetical protein